MNAKQFRRSKRKKKIRSKISGTSDLPRLSVFRSNNHIYAQLIDDINQVTIFSASDKGFVGTNIEKAIEVGKEIAKKAKKKKIERLVFDRNGFVYHGRVKALADSIRNEGIKF